MFDKWLNLPAHLYLKITALTILTVGIALSNVLMSIGTIWIISNWLIQADFKLYWQKFKEKKSVWLVVGIFFFFILSIFWSDDVGYWFKDVRIKLPFIVIPLVMGTSKPLETKHFYFLLYVFLGIMLYTSAYNFIRYNFVLEHANDIREMSVFISHVRYAVLTNFAIFICLFLVYKRKFSPLIWIGLSGWFLFYLYKSQIINGYLLFVLLLLVTFIYFVLKITSSKLRWTVFATMGVAVSVIAFVFISALGRMNKCEPVQFSELDLYTVNGNPYYHDTTNKDIENGHYIWLYVNQEEMKAAWEKRSAIPYDSLDVKGQPMYGTLMRYLTSMDLRKDSVGVTMLSDTDVYKIEQGQTAIEMNKGLVTRMNTLLMEYRIYQNGGDPNGHSLIQRLEHMKAAVGIIGDHWLFGVGGGDVPLAFKQEYYQMNSRLSEENQHRSHNQFLTLWVTLGVFGFALFIGLFIVPFFEIKSKDFFFFMVMVGLAFSCLFQDLIETQAGVTIFALFYALALYREKEVSA